MKTRIMAVLVVLTVMFAAVPAFAGHPFGVYRRGWAVPVVPLPPPVVRRRYVPPVYVPPPIVRPYWAPRPGYWVPGGYYYDSGVEIGVQRGGFGLHIDF
jgi:hypothetical protein